MKLLLWIAALFVSLPTPAYALSPGVIIQVSRKLRMSAAEAEPPRDYFVDLGGRDGAVPGQVFEVSRVISVSNGLWGGPSHLMRVVLGEIQLLAVDATVSRARMLNKKSEDQLPVLDYASFMLGDEVSLKTGLPTQ